MTVEVTLYRAEDGELEKFNEFTFANTEESDEAAEPYWRSGCIGAWEWETRSLEEKKEYFGLVWEEFEVEEEEV